MQAPPPSKPLLLITNHATLAKLDAAGLRQSVLDKYDVRTPAELRRSLDSSPAPINSNLTDRYTVRDSEVGSGKKHDLEPTLSLEEMREVAIRAMNGHYGTDVTVAGVTIDQSQQHPNAGASRWNIQDDAPNRHINVRQVASEDLAKDFAQDSNSFNKMLDGMQAWGEAHEKPIKASKPLLQRSKKPKESPEQSWISSINAQYDMEQGMEQEKQKYRQQALIKSQAPTRKVPDTPQPQPQDQQQAPPQVQKSKYQWKTGNKGPGDLGS